MPISVNPILPVLAAQSAAPDIVLQPGTVVDAQVLKILSDNLVRIAIAGLSIDVLSEVPLSAGQTLQLAVSQTPDGVRLAIVGQASDAAAGLSGDSLILSSNALVDVAANASPAAPPPRNILTPVEQTAVSVATQSAAAQQDSLAPLFANLGVAAGSNSLPPQLQQAVLQVLAQRTSLDQNLTGGDIQNGFQKSGILLEAALASGTVPSASGVPDLKAALIVLRQALLSVSATATAQAPAVPATVSQQPAVAGAFTTADANVASPQHAVPASTPSPSLAPGIETSEILLPTEILLPQAHGPIADGLPEPNGAIRIVLPETLLNAAPRTITVGAALNLLQQALQEMPDAATGALPATVISRDIRADDVTFHTNTPPPPFRGALPTAQPIASPSIASNAPLAAFTHQLLGDTDAAIARQTLLQVASLPDRVDATVARLDPAMPRWSFEIPFAMPQGTAMAQFEIARDSGGNEIEAAKRVWQARFSLDVEPAGPVHALVSLAGERTSVRMWAERPATAAQLRAGAAELSQALSKAELVPGDIVVRDGAPPQPAQARAGHFLDRAL